MREKEREREKRERGGGGSDRQTDGRTDSQAYRDRQTERLRECALSMEVQKGTEINISTSQEDDSS